jgi:hypothetical protein
VHGCDRWVHENRGIADGSEGFVHASGGWVGENGGLARASDARVYPSSGHAHACGERAGDSAPWVSVSGERMHDSEARRPVRLDVLHVTHSAATRPQAGVLQLRGNSGAGGEP